MKACLETLKANFTLAQNYIEQAIQIQPNDKLNWQIQAWLYSKTEQNNKALLALQKVLAVDTEDLYSKKASNQIKENSRQVYWEDNFNRPDSEVLRKRWIENESKGIRIAIVQGQVFMGGSELQGDIPSSLARITSEKNFIAFSGKMMTTQATAATAGIFVTWVPQGNTLYLGKDKEQQTIYALTKAGERPKWEVVSQNGKPVLCPSETRLAIAKEQGRYTFLVAEEVVARVTVNTKDCTHLRVGFFGMAGVGTTWNLYIDDVVILETE
jgi:tetratricopeptide (TPR) repeat protein